MVDYSTLADDSLFNPWSSEIDLTTKEGQSLYTKVTDGLETKYDLSKGKKWFDFRSSLVEAVERFNFNPCMAIITRHNPSNHFVLETKDIIEDLSKISKEDVKEHAENLWNSTGPPKPTSQFTGCDTDEKKIKEVKAMRLRSKMLGE